LSESALTTTSPPRHTGTIVTLLATTGIMWFGFFMMMPLMAVHITDDLALGATIAGLVLAIRQFVQFGLGLFTAALADWAGYRLMMMVGMLVRAAGFFWLAFAADVLTLILSASVSAIGGAFFDSSGKAALAALSKGYKRETIFSLNATIGNLGMSTGPLAGIALLKVDFAVVGVASAVMYLINFFILLVLVPSITVSAGDSGKRGLGRMFSNIGTVWHDRSFVLITVLLVGYYSIYSQINITLPLAATRLSGSEDGISSIYLINSGLSIALQILLIRLLARFFKPITLIGLGTLVAGIGLFLISFAGSFVYLLFCVVLYSLGRLVVEPMIAVLVSDYATESTMASYFGFSSVAMGFGGVFGSLLGGVLYDIGQQNNLNGLCWWFFGLLGGLVMLGVLAFRKRERQAHQPGQLEAVSGSLEVSAVSPDPE
jgi:MFS transporter, DHA1 family, multidrug resistance protein